MIGKLRGLVDSYGEDFVILDVRGVGYLVQCSARTLQALPRLNEVATLAIETQVREDAIRLFGFRDEGEQEWFRLLQTVQGVGAKVALAILDARSGELASAVASRDKAQLQRAQGVGGRLAERLVTELKDKVPAFAGPDPWWRGSRPRSRPRQACRSPWRTRSRRSSIWAMDRPKRAPRSPRRSRRRGRTRPHPNSSSSDFRSWHDDRPAFASRERRPRIRRRLSRRAPRPLHMAPRREAVSPNPAPGRRSSPPPRDRLPRTLRRLQRATGVSSSSRRKRAGPRSAPVSRLAMGRPFGRKTREGPLFTRASSSPGSKTLRPRSRCSPTRRPRRVMVSDGSPCRRRSNIRASSRSTPCGSPPGPKASVWDGSRSSTLPALRRSSRRRLDWKLIGYLCLGYPQEECDRPALERQGWEQRRSPSSVILER